MQAKWALNWKLFLSSAWLILCLSMAAWWMLLGFEQIDKISLLNQEMAPELERQRNMLFWEGLAWMALLIAGGVSLIYLVQREHFRSRRFREFFAAFSHDLKTSLASLRLQVESLAEDLKGSQSELLSRLVSDSVRLELQLENSLMLAQAESQKLFFEQIHLQPIVERLQHQWPQLQMNLNQDCQIFADRRAIESVFKNLVQNALIHGHATVIEFQARSTSEGEVEIQMQDNGKGFSGDAQKLGRLFVRYGPNSGSGVGLYICKKLMQLMNGQLHFAEAPSQKGFAVRILLPGRAT